MGGIDSVVQEDTTDRFLECACFAPEAIAGKARQYAMHTDSAHRFERGVDPFLQPRAMQRATQLLLDIAGGQAGPVTEVSAPEYLRNPEPIILRKARIGRVLGMLPGDDEIADILGRLGMSVAADGVSTSTGSSGGSCNDIASATANRAARDLLMACSLLSESGSVGGRSSPSSPTDQTAATATIMRSSPCICGRSLLRNRRAQSWDVKS